MPILPTQPYKGTRDFYPLQLLKRNYIFQVWRKTLISNGFVEYDTSIIENAEMYIIKSGEELGSKQLYSFTDKGDRNIALRPEMTPSLARIVAAKLRELKLPLRWFSIPNCFRYERPQKGRLREFWQLNVDIVGSNKAEIELEFMVLIAKLMTGFGATKEMFKIVFNHRQVLDKWLQNNQLMASKTLIYAVLDDWFKLTVDQNCQKLSAELTPDQIELIVELCAKTGPAWDQYLIFANDFPEIRLLLESLPKILPDVEFDFSPTIIRGLAYYTGVVVECFSKKAESPRALFGGGRYDNLLDMFGQSSPAIGAGIGEVPLNDFLEEWNLYPELATDNNKVGFLPMNQDQVIAIFATQIPELNNKSIPFEIDYDYDRSENKRYESLKKMGCGEVIRSE
jgi:histidyl-tRNA synthetase